MQTRDYSSPLVESGRPGDVAADERAGASGTGAKAAVDREVSDARDRLSSAAHDVRDEVTGAGESIASQVRDGVERRKDEAADGLRAFADTIRHAANDLGERDNSMAARVVKEAAHGLESLSGSLQSRSVGDMTRSISTFGRENPSAFFAGCLLTGVAIGRFLIASGARTHDGDYDAGDPWREDAYRTDYATRGVPKPGDHGAGYPEAGTRPGAYGVGAGGASGQAGTFGGGMVSPSSAERAPGDLDAQGTAMDAPEPTSPSDLALGEGRPGFIPGAMDSDADRERDMARPDFGLGKERRDGDL